MSTSVPAGTLARLRPRLAELPPEALLELALAGCLADAAVCSHADYLLNQHSPLPARLVEKVLLSSDLVPHILGYLEHHDGAAAAVCTLWAPMWTALLRRWHCVYPISPQLAVELPTFSHSPIAIMPDGLICYAGGSSWLSYDITDASPPGEITGGPWHGLMDMSPFQPSGTLRHEEALFVSRSGHPHQTCHVVKLSLADGTEVARSPEFRRGCQMTMQMTIAGDNLLVAGFDKILAFDSQTLAFCFQLGPVLPTTRNAAGLYSRYGCAAGNGKIYVVDSGQPGKVQIYDFGGQLRHTWQGSFGRSHSICTLDDALYVLDGEAFPGTWGEEHVLAGGESSRLRDRGLFVFGVDGTPRQELRFPQARNICAMSLYEGHLYLVEDKAAEGDEYPEMMLHVHQIMT